MSIAGEWIAGNTTVSVPTYPLHHDPDWFKDPFEYKRERWLEDDAGDLQQVFIPFSAGGRGYGKFCCPCQNTLNADMSPSRPQYLLYGTHGDYCNVISTLQLRI